MIFTKKTLVTKKIVRLLELQRKHPFKNGGQKGFAPSGIDFNYSNKCNFKCKFCFTKSGSGEFCEPKLTLDSVRNLSEQAHELGIYTIDIQGGEPLLFPDLFELIEALNPPRFYLRLTTNGYLMTEDMAVKLARAGLDRVNVSIDSPVPDLHDANRGQNGAYERALQALELTKNAGMKANVNIVCGHFNVPMPEFENWVSGFIEKGYGITFNCACPVGDFRGRYCEMLTEQDTATLIKIRLKHDVIIRDLWNFTNHPSAFKGSDGIICGCPTVNQPYINPLGDVMPCAYIHAKLGNILEQPLKEILENGFTYKYFNKHSAKCLAGEDLIFAKKYLDRDTSAISPIPVSDYFKGGT